MTCSAWASTMQLSTCVHNRLVQEPQHPAVMPLAGFISCSFKSHLMTRWCSRLITILLLHHHETLVQNLVLFMHKSQETAGWFLSGLIQDLV